MLRPILFTLHTNQNSFNKWTKISSLEIIFFDLTNDGKKWSRIYFEIDRAPLQLLLPSAKISAQNGRIGLAARPLFTIIFKLEIDNFKTQDFSPLIERVLVGVPCFLSLWIFPFPHAVNGVRKLRNIDCGHYKCDSQKILFNPSIKRVNLPRHVQLASLHQPKN